MMPSNKTKKYLFSLFGLTFFTLLFSIINPALAEEISCLKKLRNLGLDFLYLGRVESDFGTLNRYTDYKFFNQNEPIRSECLDKHDCKNKGNYFPKHQDYPFIKFYGAKLALKDKTIDCELSNKSISSEKSRKSKKSIECGDFLFLRARGGSLLPTKTYFSNIIRILGIMETSNSNVSKIRNK